MKRARPWHRDGYDADGPGFDPGPGIRSPLRWTLERTVQTLAWLLWLALLLLVVPALARAQQCTSYAEGDPIRYVLGSTPARQTGELISLGRREMAVRVDGLVRRIPYARLASVQVECTLLVPRRQTGLGGVGGVLLGLVAALVVANNRSGPDRDRGGIDVWIPLGVAAAGGAAGSALGSRIVRERGWAEVDLAQGDPPPYLPGLSPGPGRSISVGFRVPLPSPGGGETGRR